MRVRATAAAAMAAPPARTVTMTRRVITVTSATRSSSPACGVSSQLRRIVRATGRLSGELQQRRRRTLVRQRAQTCSCELERKEWKRHWRGQRRNGVRCCSSHDSRDDTDGMNDSSNDNKNRERTNDARDAEGKKPKFTSAKILDALLIEVNELEAAVAALDARQSNSESPSSSEADTVDSEFRKPLLRPIINSVAATSSDGSGADGNEEKASKVRGNWDKCTIAASPTALWAIATATVRRLRLNKQIPELQADALAKAIRRRDPSVAAKLCNCKSADETAAALQTLWPIAELDVVHIAAEVAPVAKVGGLADVVAGLAAAQIAAGHSAEVIVPFHSVLRKEAIGMLAPADEFSFPSMVDGRLVRCSAWTGSAGAIAVTFLEVGDLFETPYIYHPHLGGESGYGGGQQDVERYVAFSRAAVEYLIAAEREPDVVHLHDWHVALTAPIYKSFVPSTHACVVLTVHNFDHQGLGQRQALEQAGVDYLAQNLQTSSQLDDISVLFGGVRSSDVVVTVSPTYASEVLAIGSGNVSGSKGSLFRPSFGLAHTASYLWRNREKLFGVLNGIDLDVWNPETDMAIAMRYNKSTWREAKSVNKSRLLATVGLPQPATINGNKVPLFGVVTRLVHQKGLQLIKSALEASMRLGVQFILLGSCVGDERVREEWEAAAAAAAKTSSTRVILADNDSLARLMYAGLDCLVVPSLSEPCGLTQMIAMRYGTIPLVRATGGLIDTVVDPEMEQKMPVENSGKSLDTTLQKVSDDSLDERATGFIFEQADSNALLQALERAATVYVTDYEAWEKRVENGMDVSLQHFSWNKAEKNYHSIYDYALRSRWCNWFGSHVTSRSSERVSIPEEPDDNDSSTAASLESSTHEREPEMESVMGLKEPDYDDQSKQTRMNGILNSSVQINGKHSEVVQEKNGINDAVVQDKPDKDSSGNSREEESTQSSEKSKPARRFFPQNLFKSNSSAQAGFLRNGSVQNSLKPGDSTQNPSVANAFGSNNSSLAPTSPPVQQPALWPAPPRSASAFFKREKQ